MQYHFWRQRPLALKLTITITTVIVLVVILISALTIRRERQTFQKELEQQAELLLDTLAASGADSLYIEDADFVADLMRDLGRNEVVTFGRFYDAQGRVMADAIEPENRFSIEPDLFGKVLLGGKETVFIWEAEQLVAGQPVILGLETVGAVSVGLPTAPLAEKITAVRNQGILVAVMVVVIGLLLALVISRTITDPLSEIIAATEHVRAGDLTQRVDIQTGDELQTLGDHFNLMAAQLEQTLHQMEAEIEERKRTQAELEMAKEAAETANRAKSTFLANMSHELRTPLNAILGFSQLIARRNMVSVKDRNNLEIIIHSGEHLLMLINQVLDMSKIEAGRMTIRENEFGLYQMLEDLEGMFKLRADEKGVQFMVDVAPSIPLTIRADEMKLRQILINLLNNALKFTEAGHVILRVWPEAGPAVTQPSSRLLYFSVEDSGPGLEQEEIEMVFEAFVRTSAGIKSGEGTGLGLSLSRQFARLMGGDLIVHNVGDAPGNGAIFEFHVRVTPLSAPELVDSRPARQVVGLADGQADVRVLVVDDSWENRQLLVQLLRPLGFQVQEAENGRQAVQMWQHWQPQLVLMDLHMPVMDGYEATQKILAESNGREPVIIAVTASAFAEERQSILDAGCHDFIRKPVQTPQMLDAIHTHLGVDYRYADLEAEAAPPAFAATEDGPPASLANLPPVLHQQLAQATAQADMGQVEKLLLEVKKLDPALAETLNRLADDFEYGKILAWLQTMETQI